MPAFSRFIRYFLTVGELGSIRKAADVLDVSASAIDRQILNVEADLGMPLFERLPSGLRLTAAGEIMMAAGKRWQKEQASVRAQMEDLRGLTEVKRGLLNFTRISDTVLRPMILALSTSSARTLSYAASIALAEVENGFSQLSYPASMDGHTDPVP